MIHYSISKQKKAQRVTKWATCLRMKKEKQKRSAYINRRMKKQKKRSKHGALKNDPCYRKVILQNTSKITYCRICMNTKFCVCFRVWGRWWRWFDDMKTMEKRFGKSPISISKITYFQKICMNTSICVCFRM